jgi:hypothetical protein
MQLRVCCGLCLEGMPVRRRGMLAKHLSSRWDARNPCAGHECRTQALRTLSRVPGNNPCQHGCPVLQVPEQLVACVLQSQGDAGGGGET